MRKLTDSFNSRHFKNLLCFYIYSSFDFEFIFKCYILSHKLYFYQMLKQILQKSFFATFVSSMPVNLSQCRGTVGVYNKHKIAFSNLHNVWYN